MANANTLFDDPDFIVDLVKVGKKVGFRYNVPDGMREYLAGLISTFSGEREAFRDWFTNETSKRFLVFRKRPKWLQSGEWPLGQAGPMVFVGQINVPRGEVYAGVMQNHDASYYVFVDRETGTAQTIMQAD